jgi:O-antigen/teichoic acid export membrane protein
VYLPDPERHDAFKHQGLNRLTIAIPLSHHNPRVLSQSGKFLGRHASCDALSVLWQRLPKVWILMPATLLTAKHEATKSGSLESIEAARFPTTRVRWQLPPVWLSIGDQCVVSGLNFLTMVVLGRWSGLGELGYYSLAFTVIVVLMAMQESLLVAPFTVLIHRLRRPGRRQSYAAATLLQQLLIAGAVSLTLLVVGEIVLRFAAPDERSSIILTLAVVAPVWLLKDFARRVCFAELDTAGPLLIDGLSATVQIIALAVLALTGNLSAVSVLMAAGLGHVLAAMAWCLVRRPQRWVHSQTFWRAARLNWSLGSWSCAGRLVEMMHAYSIHWLLAAVSGPAAAGAYAAAHCMLALSNPILMGIGNLLAPQTARAYISGGMAALRTIVIRTSITVTLVTLALVLLLICSSRYLLLYSFGEVQPEQVTVIAILSAGMLAGMMSFGAENALRALARPADNFKAGVAGWCISVVVAALLITQWNAQGAALGALAGNVAAALVRVVLFLRAMHGKSPVVLPLKTTA